MSTRLEPDVLLERLEQAEQTLAAIRNGEVDALVVNSSEEGDRIFTLKGADWVYRMIVEQMSEGAATVGSDGTILYCNRRLAEMVDLPLERVIGAPLASLATTEDAPKVREFIASAPHPMDGLEVHLMSGDERRPVRLSASRLAGDLSDCLSVLVLDLSAERRGDRLEALVLERTADLERVNANLRMSERLATVGTLSAGLGHDMANLLLPVRASLDALEAGVDSPELKSDVAGIRAALDYLQRLSRGLRMLALDPDHALGDGSVRFDEWFEDSLPTLKNVLPPGVSLVSDVAPGLPELAIATPALTQAVFNIVQNAGDAMRPRSSGTVTIRARAVGTRVRISIADDGPGMSEEVRKRCMEPFFTTKPRGISTGMGLALVRGIITRIGGTVDVLSEPGEGTTFLLDIPCTSPARDGRPLGHPSVEVRLSDPRMRSYFNSILRGMGCTVDHEAIADPDWRVLDAPEADLDEIVRFLDGNSTRRVIAVGQGSESRQHPRLHRIPRPEESAHIRSVLTELARHARSDHQREPATEP